MYKSYWELDKKPFEIGCDPLFYYPSETFQTVLLKLRYTIESRQGSALLRGTFGTGKSMVAAMLARQLGFEEGAGNFVILRMSQLSAAEVLCYLAANLDVSGRMFPKTPQATELCNTRPCPGKDLPPFLYHALTTVESILMKNARDKKRTFVIVEDAHHISDTRTLDLFKSLLGVEYAGRPSLSLLFVAGNPSFMEEPYLNFVDNCIDTVAELKPLTTEESIAYIHFRLEKAGAKNTIFTEEALENIAMISGGYPRRINRICDLALLVGYAERLEEIDASVINALQNEILEAV